MNAARASIFRLLVAGLFASPMAFVHAAYLESDRGDTPTPSADSRPLPPNPPPADNALRTLVRQVEVGDPVRYRALTVFPLTLRRGTESNVATLDQTLARGWLTIQEQDAPSVPTLRVRNTGSRPMLLMAGEILLGGRQNRIVREDVLVPAESGFVDVPVYCGEQRRWQDVQPTFKPSGNLAGREVRGMAARAAPQSDVWQSIDSQLSAARVEAPTRNYQAIYEDGEARRAAAEAVRELHGVVGRETIGAVVFSRGHLANCDLFSDPELFAQLWEKICRAHAVDEYVFRRTPEGKWPPPERERVREFLASAARADMTSQITPGAGEGLLVSGAVEGRALIWREQVVHAALFPGHPIEFHPMPGPPLRHGPIPQPVPRTVE